jgi:hypothetical protein
MEFTLTYRGPLRTNSKADEKQSIRQQFHPQLREFWKQRLPHRFPGGSIGVDKQPLNSLVARVFVPEIAKNHEVCGIGFVPLITPELCLGCKLDIFFLAKGLHQRIVSNSDLDNRLKGLFDGLRRPNTKEEMGGWAPTPDETPFYCLLQNDSLITDIRITGDSLLDPSINDPDHYSLMIRVKIRPFQLTQMNADLI